MFPCTLSAAVTSPFSLTNSIPFPPSRRPPPAAPFHYVRDCFRKVLDAPVPPNTVASELSLSFSRYTHPRFPLVSFASHLCHFFCCNFSDASIAKDNGEMETAGKNDRPALGRNARETLGATNNRLTSASDYATSLLNKITLLLLMWLITIKNIIILSFYNISPLLYAIYFFSLLTDKKM